MNTTRWIAAGLMAVTPALLVSAPAEAAPVLHYGSRGLAVAVLQQTLTDLGYSTHGVDGIFGPLTRHAVEAFQDAVGLSPTGVVNAATRAALAHAVATHFTPVAGSFGTAALAQGDAGHPVVTLQGDLIQLGYRPGPASGIYDGGTTNAVRAFQRRHGLQVTGAVNQATADAIIREMGYTPPAWAGSTPPTNPPPTSPPPTNPPPTNPPPTNPPPASGPGPMVLGYYTQYSPTSTSSQNSLAAHYSQITAIAPLWYSLRSDASLHELGYQHAQVRAWAAAHSVAIYPMVINGYGNDAILRGAALRAQSVAELRALAIADGYAGFNIDFENLNNVDEAGLDSFITELAAALHPLGKKVIVDVGPRTSNANGYHVYNYQVLGQVADEVVLMAYDDHDIGSAPGPVAPLGWVQSIVNYARQEMPAQKILLGLAVYGYNWSSNGTTVELHDNQVAPLANAEGVPITWSSTDAESTFSYTASNGTVHQVWFEGSQSDAVRIALATQDHLGGVAIWRLGDETPAFWAALQGLK